VAKPPPISRTQNWSGRVRHSAVSGESLKLLLRAAASSQHCSDHQQLLQQEVSGVLAGNVRRAWRVATACWCHCRHSYNDNVTFRRYSNSSPAVVGSTDTKQPISNNIVSMSFGSLSSSCQLRQLVVVAVVAAICAPIGDASGEAGRRPHRWECDLLSTRGDCVGSGDVRTTHDKFELNSKRADSNIQLHIRCNLPVSYDANTQAT